MSRVAVGALLATIVAFPAIAMSAAIDTDGDGKASFPELQRAFPGVTRALSTNIDSDADGFVNDEETAIAIGSDLLPDMLIDT